MKRIKRILLIIVSLFIGMLNIHALPNLLELDATVINESGIKLKNSEETLSYNSKIKVSKFGNNILYKENEIINENDIKIDDLSFDNSVFDTLDTNVEVKVVNEDGASLYAGPSLLYPKVKEHINKDTTLKCVSVNKYNETFLYTEVDGVKGWLYVYNNDIDNFPKANIAYKKDSTLYTLKNSYEVYSLPSKSSSKKVISTAKDSSINYSYYINNEENASFFYVDKFNGWIYYENQNIGQDSSIQSIIDETKNTAILVISDRNIPIYKSLSFTDREQTMIPTKSVIKLLYSYFIYDENFNQINYYYIEYNGVKGWIKASDATNVLVSISGGNYIYLGDKMFTYSTYDLNNKSDYINYFDKVNGYQFEQFNGSTSSYMYYINLNNKYVWLKEPNLKNMINENTTGSIENVNDNILIYSKNDITSDIIGAIKKGTYYKEIYSIEKPSINEKCSAYYFKYVKYLNVEGWIHIAYCKNDATGVYELTRVLEDQEISDEEVENINNAHGVRKETIKDDDKEKESNSFIIIYIIIGIVIIILIIIIIIRKRANQKKKFSNFDFNQRK